MWFDPLTTMVRQTHHFILWAMLWVSFCPASWALGIPERPQNYVHDEAGLLTSEEQSLLSERLRSFEEKTSNQIVVALFPSLDGESLEDFSIELAEKWKIGQKGKDNGVILLIFPQDRKLRIEVGYGLEGVVPDAYASRIIEEKLKPAFRQGQYYGGIQAAIESLMKATEGVYEPSPRRSSRSFGSSFFLFVVLFPLFIFASIISRLMNPFGWGGATYGPSRRSRHWGSMGGSSWGGGGFGGGGGSFGGGGSSGSW